MCIDRPGKAAWVPAHRNADADRTAEGHSAEATQRGGWSPQELRSRHGRYDTAARTCAVIKRHT